MNNLLLSFKKTEYHNPPDPLTLKYTTKDSYNIHFPPFSFFAQTIPRSLALEILVTFLRHDSFENSHLHFAKRILFFSL